MYFLHMESQPETLYIRPYLTPNREYPALSCVKKQLPLAYVVSYIYFILADLCVCQIYWFSISLVFRLLYILFCTACLLSTCVLHNISYTMLYNSIIILC